MAQASAAGGGYATLARRCIDAKAKPPGSLGLLEDWAVQIAALQETLTPRLVAARLLVFAADHGITLSHPNVSAYPRAVSASIFQAIARGHAASATLCRANDCSLHAIDVGLDAPPMTAHTLASDKTAAGSMVQTSTSRIRRGSRDMLAGPALSSEESAAAQAVGRAAVRRFLCDMAIERLGEPPSALALCIGELGAWDGSAVCGGGEAHGTVRFNAQLDLIERQTRTHTYTHTYISIHLNRQGLGTPRAPPLLWLRSRAEPPSTSVGAGQA
jgi:nicotinate-nucleotide--dimethylbenzimidazole phosphoribosyltransferase